MLPFLRRKQTAALIISHRKKGGIQESSGPIEENREPDEEKEVDSLKEVAKEMMSAFESKDASRLAECLKAAFEILESEEHEEEEEELDNSYDSQNIKAAKSVK